MPTAEIVFVLPELLSVPSGGHRVVYEHADRLAVAGHRVSVVHFNTPYRVDRMLRETPLWRLAGMALNPRRVWRRLQRTRGTPPPPVHQRPGWFPLSPSVESLCLRPEQLNNVVPSVGTRVVATAWDTASAVCRLKTGRKYYFIQDFEVWEGCNASETLRTWRLPLQKMVICGWLKNLSAALGDPDARLVPNAVNHDEYHCLIPPDQRPPNTVLCYYSSRGPKDGAVALDILQRLSTGRMIDLSVLSLVPLPSNLPSTVKQHINPPRDALNRIFNESAIFVHTSFMEGWGLPPMEAMACGCACVLTDSLGVRDFVDSTLRVRLCKPGDTEALMDQVEHFVSHPTERIEAAKAGHAYVQRFTWEHSTALMQEALGL